VRAPLFDRLQSRVDCTLSSALNSTPLTRSRASTSTPVARRCSTTLRWPLWAARLRADW
jgi:hypothetical protein